jgi:hypothetical protein
MWVFFARSSGSSSRHSSTQSSMSVFGPDLSCHVPASCSLIWVTASERASAESS